MKPDELELLINGRAHRMPAGITVAAALARAGCSATRVSERGAPRTAFCGMGECQECRVSIDGQPHRLACMSLVAAGMRVESEAP